MEKRIKHAIEEFNKLIERQVDLVKESADNRDLVTFDRQTMVLFGLYVQKRSFENCEPDGHVNEGGISDKN